MTDENRILKRLQQRTIRPIRDASGNTVAIQSADKKLTITPGNSSQMDSCPWANIMGKPTTFPTTWSQVADKPAFFDGTWGSLADKPDFFDGKYSSLSGAPDISPVGKSGSYSDLTDKPTLFSGTYADLSGLPVLFDGTWDSLTGKPAVFPSTWAQVSGKPTFFSGNYGDLVNKPALFSGSYNDLTDKPAIPTMPNLATVASTGSYNDLSNKPALFNGTWASLTGKPTTLAGFGITDAVTGAALNSALGNYTTTTALTALMANKADASSVKRTETYIGKTDANGLFTVIYPTPFAVVPSLQPEPPALANQVWVKVSSTTTGFSVRLLQRNVVSLAPLLPLEVLLGATVNAPNADARVVVIAP